MSYRYPALPEFSAVTRSAEAAGLPAGAEEHLRTLYDKIAASPELVQFTVTALNAMAEKTCRIDCGCEFFAGDELLQYRFLLVLLAYEAAKANYACKGYAEADFVEAWRDVAHWGNYYLKNYGDLRLEDIVFDWYFLHVAAELFQMGRLQFQLPDAYTGDTDLSPCLHKGDPVIEFHIFGGAPLCVEACLDSMRRLPGWLQKYRPDYEYKALLGHSWLFDPELSKFLKPDSNIEAFRKLGHLVVSEEPSDILWRIFDGKDPQSVTNPSSLQKKIRDYYNDGHTLKLGYWVLSREELEAL